MDSYLEKSKLEGQISELNTSVSLLKEENSGLKQEVAAQKKQLSGDFMHLWDCTDKSNPFTTYEGCKPSEFKIIAVELGRRDCPGDGHVRRFSRRMIEKDGAFYLEVLITNIDSEETPLTMINLLEKTERAAFTSQEEFIRQKIALTC